MYRMLFIAMNFYPQQRGTNNLFRWLSKEKWNRERSLNFLSSFFLVIPAYSRAKFKGDGYIFYQDTVTT